MTKFNKKIDKLEFWKDRIDTAVKDFHTVYVTSEPDWNQINEIHSRIINENVQGKVLDAGCGYGRSSEMFAPENYLGVDFSPDFIEKARKMFPGKEFKVANLNALPFEDKSFDWAISVSIKRMVIDNLGDEAWEKMEKELRRVAKKVLILEYETPKEYEIF